MDEKKVKQEIEKYLCSFGMLWKNAERKGIHPLKEHEEDIIYYTNQLYKLMKAGEKI